MPPRVVHNPRRYRQSELIIARRGVGHEITILSGDANEHTDVRRLRLLRGEIELKRLRSLKLLIAGIALRNEIVWGIGADRCAKQRKR